MLIGILAFISEYFDSGMGMGYGTIMSPILLLMGYKPLEVIPAILFSQFITDVAACLVHHNLKNVDLGFNSRDFRVALVMGFISLVGVISAVSFVSASSMKAVSLYIGAVVIAMGVLMAFFSNLRVKFSWPGIITVSCIASFNKGASGGGFGPLMMGGQLLSGVGVKNAVGITALGEAMTCLVGFFMFLHKGVVNWHLIALLSLTAVWAVPLAGWTVKKTDHAALKRIVGYLMIILGAFTIYKLTR